MSHPHEPCFGQKITCATVLPTHPQKLNVHNISARVVSSSDNRGFAPISEQMLDLLRLCSDFDVQQVKNRSMHWIPYFRAKILNFFAFIEKVQLRDAIKSNYQGGLCKEFKFFICSLLFSYIKGRVFYQGSRNLESLESRIPDNLPLVRQMRLGRRPSFRQKSAKCLSVTENQTKFIQSNAIRQY